MDDMILLFPNGDGSDMIDFLFEVRWSYSFYGIINPKKKRRHDNEIMIHDLVKSAYPEISFRNRHVYYSYSTNLILEYRKETGDKSITGKGNVPIYIFPEDKERFMGDYIRALGKKKFDLSNLVIDL